MYVPLWAAVTFVYVVTFALSMWDMSRASGYELLRGGCFVLPLATIVYLGFWVAYLALTR